MSLKKDNNKIGRPVKSYDELSSRSKRRRRQDIRYEERAEIMAIIKEMNTDKKNALEIKKRLDEELGVNITAVRINQIIRENPDMKSLPRGRQKLPRVPLDTSDIRNPQTRRERERLIETAKNNIEGIKEAKALDIRSGRTSPRYLKQYDDALEIAEKRLYRLENPTEDEYLNLTTREKRQYRGKKSDAWKMEKRLKDRLKNTDEFRGMKWLEFHQTLENARNYYGSWEATYRHYFRIHDINWNLDNLDWSLLDE